MEEQFQVIEFYIRGSDREATMASCPDCGNKISGMAEACPHCGFPLKHTSLLKAKQRAKRRKRGRNRLFPGIVSVVVGSVLILSNVQVLLGVLLILGGLFFAVYGLLLLIGFMQ